ncbi:hypothetical protein [Noviherbaspirillum malthae]|uniref:hypothetical protein n=1 Tax=Noviherbaspirillum malthae TaxID=1260987 RepID=UPI0018909E31|nr:hypothetical protein [Noviherbaspirillum malthae]
MDFYVLRPDSTLKNNDFVDFCIKMQPLDTIKSACQKALEEARQHADWHAAYCEAVDPASVLELVAQVGALHGNDLADDRTAVLKLIRDLTGYIKLATGDKPDPVRDDLLLQAREVIALIDR